MHLWLALAVTGCTAGIGPTAALRLDSHHARRYVLGAEVGAGIAVGQAVVGVVGDRVFGRADAMLDAAGIDNASGPSTSRTFRVGVGYGGGVSGKGGVFAVGAGFDSMLQHPSSHRCDAIVPVGMVTLDLRYTDGWQLALAPRIEGHGGLCNH